jgi:hypothetical protein
LQAAESARGGRLERHQDGWWRPCAPLLLAAEGEKRERRASEGEIDKRTSEEVGVSEVRVGAVSGAEAAMGAARGRERVGVRLEQ